MKDYVNAVSLKKRWLLYLSGLVVLAVGLVLSTKCTLGVSPIMSVAYAVSEILSQNLGDMVLIWYSFLILVQLILHSRNLEGTARNRQLVLDVLQLPLSLVFTRLMNLFSAFFPVYETECAGQFLGTIPGRLLVLFIACVCTGIGASLTLRMKMVPNPGDGIVAAIAESFGLETGTAKNIVDSVCVVLTLAISLLLARKVIGIGIGSLLAALSVGRVVAVCSRLYDRLGIRV